MTIKNKRSRHNGSPCDIPPFCRNNYFTGKLLTERDFTAEQQYTIDTLRLHHVALHGWGVVCGLKVKPHPRCPDLRLVVEPGLLMGQLSKRYSGRRVVGGVKRVARGTAAALSAVLARTGTGTGGNTAYIEAVVVRSPKSPGDVGTRVGFWVTDNGNGLYGQDLFNWQPVKGNFTVRS